MSDLTDEEVSLWCDSEVPLEARMATEIRRHRAAQTASEERVRAVVFESGEYVLGSDIHVKVYPADAERLADAIVTRVAKKLVRPAGLSEPDRDILLRMRKSIQYSGEFTALLDRLLARSTP